MREASLASDEQEHVYKRANALLRALSAERSRSYEYPRTVGAEKALDVALDAESDPEYVRMRALELLEMLDAPRRDPVAERDRRISAQQARALAESELRETLAAELGEMVRVRGAVLLEALDNERRTPVPAVNPDLYASAQQARMLAEQNLREALAAENSEPEQIRTHADALLKALAGERRRPVPSADHNRAVLARRAQRERRSAEHDLSEALAAARKRRRRTRAE